jgi:polyphosphate kinase
MRRVVTRMLDEEAAKGSEGHVCLKVNHLTDEKIIRKIRRTADAGVKMDLIVRTTYAMVPHPNIRAISIVDQYLEHQRVYVFGRGEAARVFVGSSDLMERNLDWRVEVVFPIFDADIRKQVLALLQFQIEDDCKARFYDETQSNPYVGGSGGQRRAQLLTRDYFERLYRDSMARTESPTDPSSVEKARQSA